MSRRLHALAVIVIAASALLSLGAQSSCSGSAAPLKHLGEPCTRTSECDRDLVCTSGVCRAMSDAGTDASTDH